MHRPLREYSGDDFARTVLGPDPPGIAIAREILRRFAKPGLRAEKQWLEFKSDFNGSTRAWCNLLAELISMANTVGGVVIYGVSDSGELLGCQPSRARSFDPAKLADRLRRYSPTARLEVECLEFDYYRRRYHLVRAVPGKLLLVFDRDGNYQDPGSKPGTSFRAGVVYVRDTGGRRPITHQELMSSLDRISRGLADEALAKVRREIVEATPPGAVKTVSGESVPAIRVVGDAEAAPVRLVDSDEPSALRITDAGPDIPITSLASEVRSAVRLYKNASPDYRIGRRDLARWYIGRSEVQWDDDSARLALLSACMNHGFPGYWAALIEQDALEEVLLHPPFIDAHPAYAVAPYVAASLPDEHARRLLGRMRGLVPSDAARSTIDKLDRLIDEGQLAYRARTHNATFTLDGELYRVREMVEDPLVARRVFDRMMQLDSEDRLPKALKSIAYQIDLALHRRVTN